MNPSLSIYFDFLRPIAALVVVLHHLWPLTFPQHPLPWPGHQAVVVFFVLSGYVISYAATRETAYQFKLHRAARIGSVTFPALMLSLLIAPFAGDVAIKNAGPMQWSWHELILSVAVNAVFLGQSWSLDLLPPLNEPYWSLCYEVWYYAIFGVCTYIRSLWRGPMLALVLLLAGPKVLLLMPIWLMGVYLHRRPPVLQEGMATLLFAVSLIAIMAFFWLDISSRVRGEMFAQWPQFMSRLGSSNQFVGDTLLGLLVAAHFAAATCMPLIAQRGHRWKPALQSVSGYTFSLYLYHMPFAVLLWSVLGLRSVGVFWLLLAMGVVAFGYVTERQLRPVRAFLQRLTSPPVLAVRRAPPP